MCTLTETGVTRAEQNLFMKARALAGDYCCCCGYVLYYSCDYNNYRIWLLLEWVSYATSGYCFVFCARVLEFDVNNTCTDMNKLSAGSAMRSNWVFPGKPWSKCMFGLGHVGGGGGLRV